MGRYVVLQMQRIGDRATGMKGCGLAQRRLPGWGAASSQPSEGQQSHISYHGLVHIGCPATTAHSPKSQHPASDALCTWQPASSKRPRWAVTHISSNVQHSTFNLCTCAARTRRSRFRRILAQRRLLWTSLTRHTSLHLLLLLLRKRHEPACHRCKWDGQ